MKTRLLYIAIGILLAANVALLAKKSPHPMVDPSNGAFPGSSQERLVVMDSLVLRRWSDGMLVQPGFTKPTFLLFFSKTSCPSCVEAAVDYLSAHSMDAAETFVVSTDLHAPEERAMYDARFLRSLPFFALQDVRYSRDPEIGLPVLMVVNSSREILYMKQVLPSDDLHGGYLFWRRISFLYSLLDR